MLEDGFGDFEHAAELESDGLWAGAEHGLQVVGRVRVKWDLDFDFMPTV